MTKRLTTLRRIETMQKRLVALADLRLAAADRLCGDLTADQTQLRDFIGQSEPLGEGLAKAALRSTHDIDRRLVDAARLRDRQRIQRDLLKRREHAVISMVGAEAIVARREAEDRDLAEIMDAWLALGDASLP